METRAASQYGNYGYNLAKAEVRSWTRRATEREFRRHLRHRTARSCPSSIINIGGDSDWVASMQVIEQELKAVGIKITADNLSRERLHQTTSTRAIYQLAYDSETGGPAPYYERGNGCTRPNSAPIGKQAAVELGALHQPGDRRS